MIMAVQSSRRSCRDFYVPGVTTVGDICKLKKIGAKLLEECTW